MQSVVLLLIVAAAFHVSNSIRLAKSISQLAAQLQQNENHSLGALTELETEKFALAAKVVEQEANATDLEAKLDSMKGLIDLNKFEGVDGLCVVRTACAITRKNAIQLTQEIQQALDQIARTRGVSIEQRDYIYKIEGAYPNGHRYNEYQSFKYLVDFLSSAGEDSGIDYIAKAQGLTHSRRYAASLYVIGSKIPHAVCLEKDRGTIWVIDTFVQEKLEQAGVLRKSDEYLFTPAQYVELLEQANIKLGPCGVLGYPS